ncbi:hypothetical protein IPH25_04445 [bacterium]|nr:MAG: hypothetical protein IPG37_01440 [bacterium]QQR61695.1 MAG: hypothetical protein IPH25_04445 [bacterium]QQR62737.1 MAG: hypothetical protein IPH67_04990 [bacterium]
MYYGFDKAKIFLLLDLILHTIFTDCMELASPENPISVMLKQNLPGIVFDKNGFDETVQKKNVLLALPILKERLKKKLKKCEKMYGEYIDFERDEGNYYLNTIEAFTSFLNNKNSLFVLKDQESFLTIVNGVHLYDPIQYLPDWHNHLQNYFLTLKTQFKKECGIKVCPQFN